jgi:hypothetical protein
VGAGEVFLEYLKGLMQGLHVGERVRGGGERERKKNSLGREREGERKGEKERETVLRM